MMKLSEKKCIPCSGDIPPLKAEEIKKFKNELDPQWELTYEEKRLFKNFKFKNFAEAMKFANLVGELAEKQWHHPELHIGFGHAAVEIWTHKINALVESDFIFAAKVDKIFETFV